MYFVQKSFRAKILSQPNLKVAVTLKCIGTHIASLSSNIASLSSNIASLSSNIASQSYHTNFSSNIASLSYQKTLTVIIIFQPYFFKMS